MERSGGGIVDGYKKFTTIRENVTCYFDEYANYDGVISKGEGTYGSPYFYQHCNFGWGGKANGYYNNNVFDTRAILEKTDDQTIWDFQHVIYNEYFRMITNIYKLIDYEKQHIYSNFGIADYCKL